jgi:hypothetical protein
MLLAGGARAEPDAPLAILHSQIDGNIGTGWIASTNFLNNVAYDALDSQGGDDFEVPSGKIWRITTVSVNGLYSGADGSNVVASVLVQFYTSNGVLPGTLQYSNTVQAGQIAGLTSGVFTMTLPSPMVLPPGRFWLSVQANKEVAGPNGYQWHWRERSIQTLNKSVWRNPGGGYSAVCTSFQVRTDTCDHPSNSTNADLLFQLEGDALDIVSVIRLPIIRR